MFAYVTEFIGTFIFLSVILAVGDSAVVIKALPIGLALGVAILFGGNISGGHFNPAVSTMMLMKGAINVEKWAGYVIAQVLGGLLALYYFKTIKTNKA